VTDMSIDTNINDTTGTQLSSGSASVSDYFALLKPRVMSLVIFTGLVGLVVAPGTINPIVGFIAILCLAVGAGASGALNMWYDADIDAVMVRTQSRPIPSGKITEQEALTFGSVLSVGSVFVMAILVNFVAAGLLAFTIGFYVFIYTMWLKRSTPQNIVIGGAAGAFPPMIGWAAVTGSFEWQSAVLFLIIFIWTPPHFWAMSLFSVIDYTKAKVPMLPVVAGTGETRKQILFYSIALVPVAVAPTLLGFAGFFYGISATVLSTVFLMAAIRVYKIRTGDAATKAARQMFFYSILYLFLIFATLLVEQGFGLGFGDHLLPFRGDV
jgi:protoheme IX farnesyltransferase